MKEFIFKVDKKFNNFKTVDFLKAKGFSEEIIKKVKFGYVYVNQTPILNVNSTLKKSDEVKVVLPNDNVNEYVVPIKESIKILYEDEYFIAVYKEKGILIHSSKYNESKSLEQIIKGYFYPQNFTFRPINRLDKDTSGIVLIAKDEYTACLLNNQIKSNKMQKVYKAIVVGKPKKRRFIIEQPIKREEDSNIKRVCSQDGKYAKTECKLLKSYKNNLSLIEVKLHTGRTHQIRVHLSYVGLPLYADALYGEKVKNQTFSLTAYKLNFTHPFTNKKIKIKLK